VVVLIDRGSLLAEIPTGRGNDEIAVIVEPYAGRAAEGERDRVGAGAGRDDEIELEPLLVPVIDDIDPAIDAAELDFTVAADTGTPAVAIVARQVVGDAWQSATSSRPGAGVAADERHGQRARSVTALRPEHQRCPRC